jgi:hypothetical protein
LPAIPHVTGWARRASGRLGRWRHLVVLLVALMLAGCAGHSARTKEARSALDAMQPRSALALLNEELGVDSAEDLPEEVEGDNTLLLLDRAMVLQQLDDYELSSRDLQVADKAIEILDFSRNSLDDVGKYIFSDSTGPYKAPAYEKLMINTMNIINYLVRGDLNGARVEARRLAVMQNYLSDHQDPGAAMLGPGSYLGGFVFEKSGRPQEALRYYDEALQYGWYRSLEDPIRRLAQRASYRSPRIRQMLGEGGRDPTQPPAAAGSSPESSTAADETSETKGDAGETAPATAPEGEPLDDKSGELLAVVNFGRVPAKYAKRIPIGLALTYSSGFMSPYDRARANRLALQGLVTWVNYPELGKPRGTYATPALAVDSEWQTLEGILAVDREAKAAWDHSKGAVIGSAVTRVISRVVAGEGARKVAGGGAAGLLASLGTQVALTATDTPDTRSWSTLPARMAFGRVRLPPGRHTVVLEARGIRRRQRVVIRPGSWTVVNLTVLH